MKFTVIRSSYCTILALLFCFSTASVYALDEQSQSSASEEAECRMRAGAKHAATIADLDEQWALAKQDYEVGKAQADENYKKGVSGCHSQYSFQPDLFQDCLDLEHEKYVVAMAYLKAAKAEAKAEIEQAKAEANAQHDADIEACKNPPLEEEEEATAGSTPLN